MIVQFSSVQSLSRVRLFATPWIAARQASLPSPTPGVYSDSRPSSWWCHPAISSSVIPFSSCPQSLPASGSFPISQLFAWSGHSTGVSSLASFLPKNTRDWYPLGWTGWMSLQSKGLSRVFSNTTVQNHQLFGAQPSSQSTSHIHTWPLEKPGQGRRLWVPGCDGAGAAERSYHTPEVRGGGLEEQPHIQGAVAAQA